MRARRHDAGRTSSSAPRGASSRFSCPSPGLYNVYNAVAAAATALELGVPLGDGRRGARGLRRRLRAGGDHPGGRPQLSILLIKNPAGANEVLRTLTLEDGQLDLWMALNDRIADGRDVSWIWDADFEVLARARAPGDLQRHPRGGDGAAAEVRGHRRASSTVDRDLERSLDAAVANAAGERLYALPTYTALLELRDLLADRGLAKRWSE